MILLNAKDIKKSFGDKILFENVSFNIDSSDKIGLVGINGAGKSTLFKVITSEVSSDEGEIYKKKGLKIGYLDQYACNNSNKTIYEEVLDVFSDILKIEKQLEEVQKDIESKNGDIEQLVKRQQHLQDEFQKLGGFYYKSRIISTLKGLGFSDNEIYKPVDVLSGGQKTRVSLSKILLAESDLLLLDEPTNHLDIEAIQWLEGFLESYQKAFIIISHDRYFLDRVTNKTFELDTRHFYSAIGNYSTYIKQREIEKLTEQRNYINTTKEIERLEAVVEQQRRWNREKNIKTAESKLKVIDRLKKELIEPEETLSKTSFSFKAMAGGGDISLIVENLSKTFENKELFSGLNMQINRGEKVFLLGPNGCGKSTLLKIITGLIPFDSGSFSIGANTYVGYYDQIQQNLKLENTVIDEIWDEYPNMTQTQIRNALAVFLFRGEDVFKEISTLSGGERARVELTKLILKKVNFLIMDEPTNHMDIQSKEALEKALSEYNGTMLIVSHDRYFINKLADKIYYMDNDKITCFDGDYNYFLSKYEKNESSENVEKKQTDAYLSYQEQKRIESEKRKRRTRILKTEEEVERLENELKDLNEKILLPEISSDYEKAFEISQEISKINNELEKLYEIWEELSSID